MDLLSAPHDRPKGQNVYQLADEAAAAIVRNDVELIIVDEADRLTAESFDILRHVHDKSGCRVVVVGLPELLSVIDSQEKFASRVALRMQFTPLAYRLKYSKECCLRWCFATGGTRRGSDRPRYGRTHLDHSSPSLRKLRNLLQVADQGAGFRGQSLITRESIDGAFSMHRIRGRYSEATELDRKRSPLTRGGIGATPDSEGDGYLDHEADFSSRYALA